MKSRVATLAVVIAVICGLCGTTVCALPATDSQPVVNDGKAAPAPVPASKEKTANADKLKSDVLKLVADTKAGKAAPRPQQFPNTKRNNLSTGAKIGIIAAIGGIIAAVLIINHITHD